LIFVGGSVLIGIVGCSSIGVSEVCDEITDCNAGAGGFE